METEHNIRLTSAELSSLWSNYLMDSMSICVFTYFLEKVNDSEIKPIIKQALKMSSEHIEIIKKIFSAEGIPLPKGFTDEDVNPHAPKLFQDTFLLNYVKHMTKGGLSLYGAILPNIVRKDIREYYSSCLASTTELYNETTSILSSKGIEIRPPFIPYPKDVEFVEKQSFLAGWFGEQRSLTGQEIMNLFTNIQTNKLGEALVIGFGQVAGSVKIRDYMLRGKEISKKHIAIFSKYLNADDLPSPMTWDHEVEASTEAPFSDKLMMYHVGVMNASSVGNYGVAISMSQRRDIASVYVRLSAEIGKYAEDGINIMIDNAWLERPPQNIDRDALIKKRNEN
ncbi:hypothetical protein CHH83_09480 [Bacillus sp. 7586-K]|uniref:DUF3231 family protein n=1 Tax=Metabacillus niabensis TaxID=324854 RepID=A0ABT9YVF9_9BACI|nr:DUF3231 family protein [Metabacillus niabensis]MDQ0223785.1 hypothetical protein [Metabacillus niabensis]PAD69363.1 hypothetical protein CHH83_09480 [Bacillus sp. 7586-K]